MLVTFYQKQATLINYLKIKYIILAVTLLQKMYVGYRKHVGARGLRTPLVDGSLHSKC